MIGTLRHRIELFAPALTPDGGGGATQSFALVGAAWAELAALPSLSSGEGERGQRRRRLSAVVRIRQDVAPGWRMNAGARLYDIVSVEAARGRFLLTLIGEEAAP